MNKSVFFLLITLLSYACQPISYHKKITTDKASLAIDKDLPEKKEIVQLLKPYKNVLDSSMNAVIGIAAVEMPRIINQEHETLLGNFAADLYMNYLTQKMNVSSDMSVVTVGGLRTTVPAGEVTLSTLYELMPFDNEMVRIEIKGEKVKELFNYAYHRKITAIANTKLVFDSTGVLQSALIGGIPFDENKNYTLITSDYLADGGDDMVFLKNPLSYQPLHIKARDMLINYVKSLTNEGKSIHPKIEGRIEIR
jgi:2',3'-cyclic-nucleotide 2'-phosphodiesterase (5'-nucleotidase family)